MIADVVTALEADVVPTAPIGGTLVTDPFDAVALVEALQDEFHISITEAEEERILAGTVRTVQEVVRAKHKNLPAPACHEDPYDALDDL